MKKQSLMLGVFLALWAAIANAGTLKLINQQWIPWAPASMANAKGFFKAGGLTVQTQILLEYHDMLRDIAAGKADLGFAMLGDAVKMRSEGKPVKVIAEIDWSHGADKILIASALPGLAAVKGKKVGADPSTVSFYMLVQALAKVGLTEKDVVVVPMTAEAAAKGVVAGTLAAGVTWEPDASRAQKTGKAKVAFTSRSVPGIMPEVLLAYEPSIKAKRADMLAFLRGWIKGADYGKTHLNEFFQVVNQVNFKDAPLSRGDFDAMLRDVSIHDLRTMRARMGAPLNNYVADYQVFLKSRKQLKKQVSAQEVADLSLFQEAYKGM